MREVRFKIKKVVAEGVFMGEVFCEHKWLYFNCLRWCRLCERLEPDWDKIKKACNPPKQANSIVKEDKYKCPECGHICTENQMLADHSESDSGECWTNWVCPECQSWQMDLEDWIKEVT